MRLGFILILVLLFTSCQDKIKVTKEYIENGYWNNQNNAIYIEKMKVTDSTLDIFASDFKEEPNHWNIVNKIEIDNSFSASYSGLNDFAPNKPKLKGKIYFNKDNGWKWLVNGQEKEIIGELKSKTWYKFTGLKMNTAYSLYVYVDSSGVVHTYGVNLANF
jgi:hypothetical protein